MMTRFRALAAVLAVVAAPLHAQTAPSTTGSGAASATPAAPKPAAAPVTYDRTGVGDTSMFAPLDLTAPNIYRAASGAPGPKYWQNRADYDKPDRNFLAAIHLAAIVILLN